MIRRLPIALALLAAPCLPWPSAWQPAGAPALAQAVPATAPTDAPAGTAPEAQGAPGDVPEQAPDSTDNPANPPAPPAADLGPAPEPSYETATVRTVDPGATAAERRVTVRLTSGAHAGTEVEIDQHLSGQAGFDLPVVPGDEVVVVALVDPAQPTAPPQYQLADYQRARPVTWLLVGTAILMVLVGGWRGLKTLGVLALTGAAVIGVLIPLTLRGISPLPVAIALAAAIALVTTLLTSGPGRKSWAAVLGTTGAVALATGVATFAAALTRLSGLGGEEAAGALAGAHGPIDFAGLLAAGMVVGALGVMLDLALSISAAVDELAEANPSLGRGLLFQAGWQVGRDLLSTSSNTLLLAYLGGFLPVLLSYGAQGLSGVRLVHQEGLAAEVVTLAIGLVGLLAAVPLTAAVATLLQPPAAPAGVPDGGASRAMPR